jgi:hypothetical protein
MNLPWPAGPATLKHESCVGPVTGGRLRRLSRITSGSQSKSLPHEGAWCVFRATQMNADKDFVFNLRSSAFIGGWDFATT